ncbi:MAG: phosphoribosylglycinamide formyltransferase [Oscillospiraceae bacterium]|jgi:phosphoribosylglycinamide formyltransferase-1|nr:phosphoribosylglycinamide formyltransferase [Oscillospiraceae bacterium]
MNISVLVSGGGTNLQSIIDRIRNGHLAGVHISLVIASNAEAYAIKRAESAGVPVRVIARKDFSTREEYDSQMLSALVDAKTELVVLAGFLSLLGPSVIRQFSERIINIHPALIPSFCGPGMYGIRPHQAALERGVKVSGATVHFVNEHYDEGPIILQKAIDIMPDDTPETLQKRIMVECEQELLPQAIRLIADRRVQITNNIVTLLADPITAGKETL